MTVDLTKLKSTSLVPAFKNNDESSGSFTLSGTWASSAPSKILTKTIQLPSGTDIADVMFKGRADGGFSSPTNDPRDNDAWFKRGAVWAATNDGGSLNNYPTRFLLAASVADDVLTITATANRQYTGTLTITSETVYYKIIDYSVF